MSLKSIKSKRIAVTISPFLLFAAILFFRFKDLIIGGKILYYGDIESYAIPSLVFVARSVINGKIPLWAQNLYMGYPFFTNPQNGTYYFLNILYDYLSPNYFIINYTFIFSILLVSFFSYLYFKEIGIRRVPSIVASILFTYSGFILTKAYDFIPAYWFIPAIFLFFEKYNNDNNNFIYILISGLLFGFQILSGSPEISFITLTGLAIYTFIRLLIFKNKPLKKENVFQNLISFFSFSWLTVAIGFLISMVQVLSTFVESINSNVSRVSPGFVLQGSLHPLNLFRNFLNIQHNNSSSIFFGFLTPLFLILIIISLKYKKKFHYNYVFNTFLLFILIVFLIAFGRYFILYNNFLIHLPLFDKFPLPSRFLILAAFGVACLSGIALDVLFKKIELKNVLLSRYLSVVFVIVVCANVFFMPSQFDATTTYKRFDRTNGTNNILYNKLKNKYVRVYPITGTFPYKINIQDIYPYPYILSNFLIAQTPLYFNGAQSITGIKEFVSADYTKIVDTARSEGFGSGLYKLFNLKYIVSGQHITDFKKNISLVYRYNINGYGFHLYEMKNYYARIFLVGNVFFLKNNSDIFKHINNPFFNPEENAFVLNHDSSGIISYNDCSGNASIKKWSNDEIDIKADTDGKCFLFISNTFFSGWKAHVNGNPERIYKTDYNFQGLFLKKGSNKVELKFQPLYFKIGELISIISLGNLILLLLYMFFKRRFK